MNARSTTAKEEALFRRWQSAVKNGRRDIEKMLAAGAINVTLERWRQRDELPVSAVFSNDLDRRISSIVERWNELEDNLSRVERGKLGISLSSNEIDIDVRELKEEDLEGVLLLIGLGIVIIGGAYALTEYLSNESTVVTEEIRLKHKKFDAAIANAPQSLRDEYQALRKKEPLKKDLSWWQSLTGGAGGALGIGALVLLGFFAFSAYKGKKKS